MKITNKLNLPDAIVKALQSDYKYKEKQFSATTILNGTKNIILQKRHNEEIEMDAADGINMLMGTAIHNIFEGNQNESELAEEYLVVKLPNEYKVSGRLDLYNLETKTLTDYKTCAVYKIKFNDFEDWHKQLMIYAWMLSKSGMECEKVRITYLIKDYKPSDYKLAKLIGDFYPETQIGTIEWKVTAEDLVEIEKFIIAKFTDIAMNEERADDDIPYCSDEERWYSGNKYAVKKGTNKIAKKVCDTKEEAEAYIKAQNDSTLWIEERKGINRKCEDYCNCCEYCNFYRKLKEEEENV